MRITLVILLLSTQALAWPWSHHKPYEVCIGFNDPACQHFVAWNGCQTITQAEKLAKYRKIAVRGSLDDRLVCQSTPEKLKKRPPKEFDATLVQCRQIFHCQP